MLIEVDPQASEKKPGASAIVALNPVHLPGPQRPKLDGSSQRCRNVLLFRVFPGGGRISYCLSAAWYTYYIGIAPSLASK